MKEIIKLREVAKYYEMEKEGEVIIKALDGVNFSIQKGEFVAIMGPSGSGKSTGMNLVGCLDIPTSGEIYLEGYDIAHLEESELAQIRGRKIGFIFQGFNLIPTLTAKGNVMLPMMFQGMSADERAKRAEELLQMVELGERMDHYPSQLSGGQQQRVAIARALANNPEVILADEPTGNLDTKTGEKVLEFLQNLNSKGKTIVLVTHSPELAEKYAKKIYYLRDGKIEKIVKKVGNSWKKADRNS